MTKSLLLSVYLVSLFSSLSAQTNITGRILSATDSRPLVGASVYINNTTIGSTTDSAGKYSLRGVPAGTHELVASFVSYQTIVYKLRVEEKPLVYTFMLESKPQQMRNILVLTNEQRKRKLQVFRQLFLGITSAAEKCRIINEDEIMFEETGSKGDMLAYSAQPLEIVNPELGYRIFFDLVQLSLDQRSSHTFFYGYCRYEDLDKKARGRYNRKRLQYYTGSTMHFYHSLHNRSSQQEGFSVFGVSQLQDAGVMYPIDAARLLVPDSSTGLKRINAEKKMVVRYNKDPWVKKELMGKTMIVGNLPNGVETTVNLLEQPVLLDVSGLLLDPLSVSYSGFWSYEKLALMLPLDYRPPPR